MSLTGLLQLLIVHQLHTVGGPPHKLSLYLKPPSINQTRAAIQRDKEPETQNYETV